MTTLAAAAQPRRDVDATWWERSEDLMCVLGGDLVLRAANPAWGRVLGRPPHDFLGAHVFECVHPDNARVVLYRLPTAADRFTHLQCRLRDARGRWRWMLWSGVRRGAAWDCSGKDVTALRERTGRGRHGDALARVLRDGLCEVGADGRIVEVNERFCKMVGFSAAELEGTRAPFAFWPEEHHDTLAAQFALSLPGDERRLELVFCRKDGERFPVTLDASHIEVGAETGAFICVIRDMSREVAERERLREAHRVARLASWELDPTTLSLEFSSDLRHIGGLRLPSDPRAEHVLALVADADRDRAVAALAEVTSGDADELVLQTAVEFAPHDTRHLETRMQVVRGAGGAVRRVRGTTQDVTARRRAELAREESEERLRQAQRMSGMGSFEVDYSTATINWSPELYRLFGVEREHFELELSEVRAMLPARDSEHVVEQASETISDGRPRRFEHRYLRAGEPRWAEMRLERLGEAAVRGTMQDITARKEAQREIDLQAQLLDAVEVALIATDLQGCVTHWNRGAERLYGWSGAEVLGRSITEFTVVPEDDRVADEFVATVLTEEAWEGEFEVGRKDGRRFPVYMRGALFVDADGQPAGIVGVSVDLSERYETARRLRAARDYSRAITDSMGEGLFTVDGEGRLTYMNSAAGALLGWEQEELVGRDMHNTIHHRRPDGTPFDVAECPLYAARREGRLVRVEDDVFIRRDGSPLPVAYTATPFDVGDGDEGSVVVFSDISHRKAEELRLREQMDRVTWAGHVHEALHDERMELHAQPIVELASGRTVQHELLIRMRDRNGAVITPDRFLPAAEEYGAIVDIDRWVISRAAELAGNGHAVELNLSARSLGAPGLVDHFQAELARTGADPGLLVVELTETALLEDGPAAEAFIEGIKAFGCKLALDDFGTGYGGFVYVKRLPVDYLKIDIEFVRDLVVNQASQEVVRAIVGLARGFGQRTVAEGAEDDRTLQLLRELGVDYAQGYGIARPAPVAEVLGG